MICFITKGSGESSMDERLVGKVILLQDTPEGKRGMIQGENGIIYRFYQSNLKRIDTSQLEKGSVVEFTYMQKKNQKYYVQSMEFYDPFSLRNKEKLVSLLEKNYPNRTEYQSTEIQKVLESSFSIFYKQLGYKKIKDFFLEKYSDVFAFEERTMNNVDYLFAQVRPYEEWHKKEESQSLDFTDVSFDSVSESDLLGAEYLKLLEQYEKGEDYEAYLNTFSTYDISPTMLPVSWIEKTVRICQKLIGEEGDATFNSFDRLLIQVKTPYDLTIQGNTAMIQAALEHCRFPYHEIEFLKSYGRVFFKQNFTLNHRWELLVRRFTLAENKYYIYFFIIELYAYKKVKVLTDYLDYVENSRDYEYVETFFRLAEQVLDTEENHEDFYQKYVRFMGISLDDDRWEYIEKTYPIVQKKEHSVIQEMIEAFRQEDIPNDFLVQLLDERISLALGEKCINYYLYKKYHGANYSEKDLDLFGEILYHYPSADLDEVIFNNSYSSYTEEVKRDLLLKSWRFLVDHLEEHPKYYLVLCYIVHLFSERTTLASELSGISTRFLEKQLQIVEKDIDRFQEIYLLFRLSDSGKEKMEHFYSPYIYERYSLEGMSEEEVLHLLTQFQKDGCSFIVTCLLNKEPQDSPLLQNREILKCYLDSLKQTHRYSTAIQVILETELLSTAEKDKEVISTLYQNYKIYGASDMAYEVFEAISMEQVEQLCFNHFIPNNGVPIILMSIYAKKKEWPKVSYLSSLYYNYLNKGNRSFFSDLFRQRPVLAKIDNHNSAVREAFLTYNSEEIFEFLDWTKYIRLMNAEKYYHPGYEKYAKPLSFLLKTPTSAGSWQELLASLKSANELSSAFGYAAQCFYITHFLKGTSGEGKIDFDALSEFVSLSTLPASHNFFALNKDIYSVVPEPYLLKLSDYLKKNEFLFQRYSMSRIEDAQDYYDALLGSFNDSKNIVYFEVALSVFMTIRLDEPHFEKYALFCGSNRNKTSLFRILFQLLKKERNQEEVHEFVNFSFWNCSAKEKPVLYLLNVLSSSDVLPEDIESLPLSLQERFKTDCLQLLENFPEISGFQSFISNGESLTYRMIVLKYLFQCTFDNAYYWDFEKLLAPMQLQIPFESEDFLNAYLEYCKVSCWQQAKFNDLGEEFISRRYIELLLIYKYQNYQGIGDWQDEEDIVDLMRENNHVSLIFDKYFQPINEVIEKWLATEGVTKEIKESFLLSCIVLSASKLVSSPMVSSLNQLSEEAYEVMRTIVKDLARAYVLSVLKVYFQAPEETRKEIEIFASHVVLDAARVIRAYENSEEKEEALDLVQTFLSTTDKPGQLRWVFGQGKKGRKKFLPVEMYCAHRELVISLLLACQYDYGLIQNIGNYVRNGTALASHPGYKDLFDAIHKPGIYEYLNAIYFAHRHEKEEAIRCFYRIDDVKQIPPMWQMEYQTLEKYIRGEGEFSTQLIRNNIDMMRETMIQKVDFLKPFQKGSLSDRQNEEEEDSEEDVTEIAQSLFSFINTKNVLSDRIRSAEVVFTYLLGIRNSKERKNNVDSRFSILVKTAASISKEKFSKTYNELIFDYGFLLLDEENRSTTYEKKVDILIDLFRSFDLLKESHKNQFGPMLKSCFQRLLLEKQLDASFLSYEKWLAIYPILCDMAQKFHLSMDDGPKLHEWVTQCLELERMNPTVTKKRKELEKLPSNVEFSPIAMNFLMAVQKEYQKLISGTLLTIMIDNHEIEKRSIFFSIQNSKESKISVNLESDDVYIEAEYFLPGEEKPNVARSFCSHHVSILRPGERSGEQIEVPQYILNSLKDEDSLIIHISVVVHGHRICDNSSEGESFTFFRNRQKMLPTPKTKYNTTDCAFTEGNMGFGRKKEIEWLNATIPNHGLSIIYGPSRTGKSSLLQYLTNFLAVDYQKNPSKYREDSEANALQGIYVLPVADSLHPGDYVNLPSTEEEILEYLFIESIRRGLLQGKRKIVMGEEFSSTCVDQILEILSHREESIADRLSLVSDVLSQVNGELWLLLDEFQQVIEKWKMQNNYQLLSLCNSLRNGNTKIRIVLCGSDDFVKLILSNDQNWSPIFSIVQEEMLAVGQLDAPDFGEMLSDSHVWGEKVPFTKNSLSYMFEYTGGNAMYGKLIGNKIIEEIQGNRLTNREFIYPADISRIVAEVLDEQNSDMSVNEAQNNLITNTTKNLEQENRYLVYIADCMQKDSNSVGVPLSRIYENFCNTKPYDINLSLKVCCVRGILKEEEIEKEVFYKFSTLFYYSLYCFKAKKNGVVTEVKEEEDTESNETMIIDTYNELSDSKKQQTLSTLWGITPQEVTEDLRGKFGVNVQGDYISEGGTKNVLHIENVIQSFSTILSGNLSGPELLEAYEKIPTLSDYYSQEQKNQILELEEKIEKTDDEEEKQQLLFEAEEIKNPVEKKYANDFVQAAIIENDEFDFDEIDSQRIRYLLHLSKYADISYLEHLPKEFQIQFDFAILLHNVFDKLEKMQEEKEDAHSSKIRLDYCPLAIMYCKLVEAILKKKHTPVYIRDLPDATIGRDQVTFGALTNPRVFDSNKKHLTIGAFTTHIVYPRYNLEKDENSSSINRNNIQKLSHGETQLLEKWETHAKEMAKVLSIRNLSAHEAVRVTKRTFDILITTLFAEGELSRLLELGE